MAAYAFERGCFNIVPAVDADPEKVGTDLGELCGTGPIGVTVRGSLEEALTAGPVDVVLVTTVSSLAALAGQAIALAEAGIPIVSTCEELFSPWKTQPQLAERIDRKCRAHGVVCLGTGVNPGYLMDYLATVLTGACRDVRAVRVERVQDASIRRSPFQQKIGAGPHFRDSSASFAW